MDARSDYPAMGVTLFFGLTILALLTQGPPLIFANPSETMADRSLDTAPEDLPYINQIVWARYAPTLDTQIALEAHKALPTLGTGSAFEARTAFAAPPTPAPASVRALARVEATPVQPGSVASPPAVKVVPEEDAPTTVLVTALPKIGDLKALATSVVDDSEQRATVLASLSPEPAAPPVVTALAVDTAPEAAVPNPPSVPLLEIAALQVQESALPVLSVDPAKAEAATTPEAPEVTAEDDQVAVLQTPLPKVSEHETPPEVIVRASFPAVSDTLAAVLSQPAISAFPSVTPYVDPAPERSVVPASFAAPIDTLPLIAPALAARVTADGVYLRETPGFTGRPIAQFDAGAFARVYETRGDWARIAIEGRTGWMSTVYLSLTGLDVFEDGGRRTGEPELTAFVFAVASTAPSVFDAPAPRIVTSTSQGSTGAVLFNIGSGSSSSVTPLVTVVAPPPTVPLPPAGLLLGGLLIAGFLCRRRQG